MGTPDAMLKSVELLAATGMFLLGAGIGAWFGNELSDYVFALLIMGALCHGVGMFAKHRLEAAQGVELPAWNRVLYQLCWLLLAALALLLLLHAL